MEPAKLAINPIDKPISMGVMKANNMRFPCFSGSLISCNRQLGGTYVNQCKDAAIVIAVLAK
jgi:hypothetical protein